MKLSVVRTNFSQFASGLCVQAVDGSARLECDLAIDELPDFAMMLLGLADDCLAKLGRDYTHARDTLEECEKAIRAS